MGREEWFQGSGHCITIRSTQYTDAIFMRAEHIACVKLLALDSTVAPICVSPIIHHSTSTSRFNCTRERLGKQA